MMNGKRKKAPNLGALLKTTPNSQKEIFILIGDNVWNFYRSDPKDLKTNGLGTGWKMLADLTDADNAKRYEEIPIILDNTNLSELYKLDILPLEHQVASIIDTDEFFKVKTSVDGITIRENQQVLTDLCTHLTKTTAIQHLTLRNNIGELLEDLSGYISRIRNNEASLEAATPELIELDAETLKKLSPAEKAEYFYKWLKIPLAYHADQGIIYRYNGIIWEIIQENELQRQIKQFFEEYGTKYGSVESLNNIIKCLNVDLPLFMQTDVKLLAFKNGVLNKNTLQFMPHSKDYYLTGVNPCDYLETQTPTPNFDKWINFISYDSIERKKSLLAALYMILNNRYDWQLTLELIGEAGSGKSTFLEVAKLISGEGNYTAIDLELLKDDKARDIILNKTFLFSPDQSRYIGDASIIKAISGGDDISFNPKNKKSFSSKVNAIIAICSNTLPIYKNDGGGMERRRVLFPFYKAVEDSERDDQLFEKIQQELGGIIRKLYDEFKQPEEAKQALLRQQKSKEALAMKTENDHILEFIEEFDLLPEVSNKGLILGSMKGMPSIESPFVFDRLYWCYLFFCDILGRTDKARLKPKDLLAEMQQAFKTAGYKIKFTNKQLKGGYNYTNATFKDKQKTIEKWRNA
ncbi:DNA primase family protein [Avibacterium avium]|uniref:Phage/plasmid primase, P4 family, C-terminal domain n=1 Tax=Avibacterium avium TaxID=751 RepID=A0A379ANS7_AVIAV|nr:DUF5906 domain-containing protein [Avibacterium avium]SUB23244.1 phage/plasmid primase, P4 family, C-terminal domain [Avibacterium avium]